MQELDDIALLREYVERQSEEAFGALVTRHVSKVYAVALRHTGNTHQAEEITQAVFVILARKSAQLRKSVILEGWLYQTARLTALTFIRGEIRRNRREQEAHMQALPNETETEVWRQIAPLLDAAMAGLNDPDRHAVVLRFFYGKSMREIGAALGGSEDAAKMRVNRALEKLRRFFANRGVVSTTAMIAGSLSTNSIQAAPLTLATAATALAMAKGEAAGSATSTLIKGALKVMAWTKAKTAVVAGAAILLAAGTTTVIVKHAMAAPATGLAADPSWASDPQKWQLSSTVLDALPSAFILRTTQFPNQGGGVSSNERYLWKNVTVQTLIGTAYGFPETRIVFPADMPPGRFDLLITVADHPKEQLQDQIKKRFGLTAHVENREADVLLLKVSNPNPPNLKRHDGNNNASSWVGRNNTITIRNQSFNGFARSVESAVKQPVIDETGLTDRYDLDLQLKAKPGESKDDEYRRALLEQLGLELVPDRAAIDELVVEKVN